MYEVPELPASWSLHSRSIRISSRSRLLATPSAAGSRWQLLRFMQILQQLFARCLPVLWLQSSISAQCRRSFPVTRELSCNPDPEKLDRTARTPHTGRGHFTPMGPAENVVSAPRVGAQQRVLQCCPTLITPSGVITCPVAITQERLFSSWSTQFIPSSAPYIRTDASRVVYKEAGHIPATGWVTANVRVVLGCREAQVAGLLASHNCSCPEAGCRLRRYCYYLRAEQPLSLSINWRGNWDKWAEGSPPKPGANGACDVLFV